MGTVIFSYIRRLQPVFGVQNFEFQYFWGIQNNDFCWYDKKCGYFWGVITNWTIFGVISRAGTINRNICLSVDIQKKNDYRYENSKIGYF